jgi:glycosyltransferase involved in cell wall biosynthesis
LADTADEFAKALCNLILDTEFRVKMGKKAREHVLINFSEELFKTKMKNIVI